MHFRRVTGIIKRMKTCFIGVIRYIIQIRRKDVVLIDTPVHGNCGDHAIALAEQALLEKFGLKYCEVTAFDIHRLERLYAFFTPRKKIIIIHGGGFLGNLWPNEELRVRKIIKAFSEYPIIIMPQTVTFDLKTDEGKKFFSDSAEAYCSHKKMCVFVRERGSYVFFKQHLPSMMVKLVPDLVLQLKTSFKEQRKKILFCMRRDCEKKVSDVDIKIITEFIHKRYPNTAIEYTDTVINHLIWPRKREMEVREKLKEFASAQFVITDRLHGMIFSLITDTPCIALDNSNGKVEMVYQWIHKYESVQYAKNIKDIPKLLKVMNTKGCTYDPNRFSKEFEPIITILKNLKKLDYGSWSVE